MLTKLDMVLPVELLGLSDIQILNISLRDRRELIIEVKSTKDDIVCRNCGKKCEDHGYDRAMELRHLPILGYKTFIQIAPKRGICYQCAEKSVSTTQTLSWYDRRARQTKPYEQHLLFEMINSTIADVSRKEEIDEETIQTIIDKNIATDIDFSIIVALGIIGIDEISLRKGRKRYVTVITYRYKDEVKLLKIIEGRNKDDILKFFKSIPSSLRNTVSAVCSDLYEGYINAAKEVFGNNIVVADRFHVSKLYRKKLIDVRKSELKRLKSKLSKEEYQELNSAVAILRKGKDYFNEEEKVIVDMLFKHSPKLKLVYAFSHRLTSVFNSHLSKIQAKAELMNWIADVQKSKLRCFDSFITTLTTHIEEVSNYFIDRNSSGFVEGFNNRLKVLTRRCYGLKNAKRFFQRIKIDTEGLALFRFSGVQYAI